MSATIGPYAYRRGPKGAAGIVPSPRQALPGPYQQAERAEQWRIRAMTVTILQGDCRALLSDLPDGSVNCCVTSPPYFGLRDYGVDGQIGLEETPDAYVGELVAAFREVRRALSRDGTLWLNLADSYAGGGNGGGGSFAQDGLHCALTGTDKNKATRHGKRGAGDGIKAKDMIGIPWSVAFALRADGWWLRSAIIWAKPNGMPGSQHDRCTSSYETVFMLSKSASYWSDFDAIKTPPRESTLVRTAQDVQAQAGSHGANGGAKTNGAMKAVGGLTGSPHGRHSLGEAIPEKERRSDKQRGHSRKHAGFNDRWDAMEKSEQMAKPAMMRDVWFVSPASFSGDHFAVMPDEVARRCILAGCPYGGTVLDPFGGVGTTAMVADRLGRDAVLIEMNPKNADQARRRIEGDAGMFAQIA